VAEQAQAVPAAKQAPDSAGAQRPSDDATRNLADTQGKAKGRELQPPTVQTGQRVVAQLNRPAATSPAQKAGAAQGLEEGLVRVKLTGAEEILRQAGRLGEPFGRAGRKDELAAGAKLPAAAAPDDTAAAQAKAHIAAQGQPGPPRGLRADQKALEERLSPAATAPAQGEQIRLAKFAQQELSPQQQGASQQAAARLRRLLITVNFRDQAEDARVRAMLMELRARQAAPQAQPSKPATK
jgi:hypothetical protein